jgi:hypothetical protein
MHVFYNYFHFLVAILVATAALLPLLYSGYLHPAVYLSPPAPVTSSFLQPSVSAFFLPSHWCTGNIFLWDWKPSQFEDAAEALVSFRSTQNKMSLDSSDWRDPGHSRFNAMPPLVQCSSSSGGLVRYPPEDAPGLDGGKWLCSIEVLQERDCVIFSLGSNAEFSFEYDMVRSTPCQVHSFDCTVSTSEARFPKDFDEAGLGRVHFHPLCIGLSNGRSGPSHFSLNELAIRLGISRVSLLKIDVEGYEFRVLEMLYAEALRGRGLDFLPLQISFELHAFSPFVPNATALNNYEGGGGMSAGEMQVFWTQLSDLGYVPVSREDNVLWGGGSEFTVVRAFC